MCKARARCSSSRALRSMRTLGEWSSTSSREVALREFSRIAHVESRYQFHSHKGRIGTVPTLGIRPRLYICVMVLTASVVDKAIPLPSANPQRPARRLHQPLKPRWSLLDILFQMHMIPPFFSVTLPLAHVPPPSFPLLPKFPYHARGSD